MTDTNAAHGAGIRYLSVDDALSETTKEIDKALKFSPSVIRRYTKHLAASRGKMIRAMSLITCAQNKEGLVPPNAVKFAAAIEILHLATLVHDDIIDDADVRRGKLTLQRQFGKRAAVICGDYLLTLALRLGADIPNRQDYLELDFPDYISRVCFGELYQYMNNGNFDLSVYKYLKIISGKTAALFEASFFAGAVLSGAGGPEIRCYRRIGRYAGMIFQLTDDCMDFEATENIARKPVQSDYEQNVFTLPLIHAFQKLAGFRERARKNEVTGPDVNEAVFKSGGLVYTRNIAKKYYNKCIKILDEMDITAAKRNGIEAILGKALRVN